MVLIAVRISAENRADLLSVQNSRKTRVAPYTAVAVDPDVPLSEPILGEAEAAIKAHWKAYRNKFPDKPRQIIRAVLLEALSLTVRTQDPIASAIVWLTGSSLLPWIPLGSEEKVLQNFLMPLGEAAEKQSVKEWTTNQSREQSVEFPEFNSQVEVSKQFETSVDEAVLAKHLMAAAGPSDAQGQATGPNPNPHWPQNNPGHWVTGFGSRAAKGIKETVDKANAGVVANVNESLKEVPGILSDFAEAMRATLINVLEQTSRQDTISERKTNLLWWKETLYSPSLRISYRRLEPSTAVLCMAYDLVEQAPGLSPQSVEFLLREVMRASFGSDASEALSLADFCSLLKKDQKVIPIREALGNENNTPGRTSLLSFVSSFIRGLVNVEDLKDRVGISMDMTVPHDEIAVWLYRDLRARRLANGR